MYKFLFYLILTIFLTSCSLKYENNFDIPFYQKSLNTQTKNTFDSCTSFSYIQKDFNKEFGNIFIEYIDINYDCNWNGFQRGYFEDLFKDTLKLKSMKLVERFDYSNYEFSTYKINDDSYMSLIYKFSALENYFIVDYSGVLYSKLIKSYNQDYTNKFIDKKRYNSKYFNSLVNRNIINNYFSKERSIILFD